MTADSLRQIMSNGNLEGFDERPEQSANTISSGKQLHQPHHSEQSEETDAHERLTFL